MGLLERYPEATDGPILFERCRYCAGAFEYKFDGASVNILLGVPRDASYCALSYVWGDVRRYTLLCRGCNQTTIAPLASIDKFRSLMWLGSAPHQTSQTNNVWLDAISIDQSSGDDVSRCIGAMGEIYEQADFVAVLLPHEDSDAFDHLTRLTACALIITMHDDAFRMNEDARSETGRALSDICQEFWSLLGSLETRIAEWSYWKRAWTFQEWALARDLNIGVEAGGLPEGGPTTHLKVLVWRAGTLLAVYKLRQHQYAAIDQGFSRSEVTARFEVVKRVFPIADVIMQYDEADEDTRVLGTILSSMAPLRPVLGLLEATRSEQGKMKARLQTALNSFGMSKRQTSFEADLICCWTSMCNVNFGYKRDDKFEVALQKVLKALRSRGIKIYNFNSNTTGASGEVDVLFLDYASEHRQCNSMQQSRVPGAPIFTGFTDTVEHIKAGLSRTGGEAQLVGDSVALRRVIGAKVKSKTRLDVAPAGELVAAMAPSVVGSRDGIRWRNVLDHVKEHLESTTSTTLSRFALLVATVPCTNERFSSFPLHSWCIYSADHLGSELFVAREALNGTLVVATPRGPHAHIVGYLVMTSQQSGTRLVETDEAGKMVLEFKAREVSGIGITMAGGDMAINTLTIKASVELEDETTAAF